MAEYDQVARKVLLKMAKDSIAYGLAQQQPMSIQLDNFSAQLQQPRACFVTLHINGMLRGCIGSLVAIQPLIADVAANAYKAAFQDPRFPPLTAAELDKISLDISILSPPSKLQVTSEADLLQKLRPGIDGLILSDRGHRATFLPSVWEQLPNPTDFVIHLKNKAGLTNDYWSDTMQFETYTAELIA